MFFFFFLPNLDVQLIYHNSQGVLESDKHFQVVVDNLRLRREFSNIMENYIFGKVYNKIFPSLNKMHAPEDQLLFETIQRCREQKISLITLGVRKEFRVPNNFEVSWKEFDKLNEMITPLEKMSCIQKTIDGILKAVAEFLDDATTKLMFSSKDVFLTTDDLLPILCYIIISSNPNPFLFSNFIYLNHFQINDTIGSELDFTLVTFQAVLELLKNNQFVSLPSNSEAVFDGFPAKTKASHSNFTYRASSQGSFTRITPTGVVHPDNYSSLSNPNNSLIDENSLKSKMNNESSDGLLSSKNNLSSTNLNSKLNNDTKSSKKDYIKPPEVINLNGTGKNQDLGSFLEGLMNSN